MEKIGKRIGKFIDPLSDFGFKLLFGSEPNKDLLISLLNELFKGRKQIVDLTYNKNENNGPQPDYRRSVYDLTCTGKDGEQFIIEVQKVSQPFFRDRAVYYTSTLIHDQGPKGSQRERPSSCRWQERWSKDWDFQLKEVYLIGLMEFCLADTDPGRFFHRVHLAEEETGKLFYEKLGYIFIEIPKFNKAQNELNTDLDRWLYVLKNMSRLQKISVFLRKPVFEKLFRIAAVSNLSKKDYMQYEKSLMARWDQYAILKGAKEEGLKEGLKKGSERTKTAAIKNMLKLKKFTLSDIAKCLDVTEAFVRRVKKAIQ